MIKSVLAQTQLNHYPLMGFVLFAFAFAVVLCWVFRKNSREFYRRMSLLALEGEDAAVGEGK